jgi:predicted amidophosphoribosyltransferase
VKLPPLALVAPSLCPRCDQPAMVLAQSEEGRCAHCAMQLHKCGSCRGTAGPFDRFCGFCGHELVRGEKRPAWWRLWFLVALVPLAVGLIYGIAQGLGRR